MNKVFEAALSINEPWYVRNMEFNSVFYRMPET